MSRKLRPIILAGGVGKRLWPLSTDANPKQFIPIFKDLSLFDLTLQRINHNLFKKPLVVTSEKYLKQTTEAFERTGLKPSLIVLEPESKNTYSAIISAAILSSKDSQDERFIAMPSDHYISNNKNFYAACKRTFRGNQESLYLFGVRPEYASSEYGYISHGEEKIIFKEKPNTKKAKEFLEQENVYWNCGIFIFGRNWLLNRSNEVDSNNFNRIKKSIKKGKRLGNLFYPEDSYFASINSISFDHGFVEKCNQISMIVLDAGWSDLGSWVSLRESQENPLSSLYGDSINSKIERPWGFFQILMETSSTKVKLIKVMPKQKLSLQKHKFRSETWYVIKGRAKVTRNNEKFTLELGDSIIIEKGEIHSLENVENVPLEIIEIQTGNYLGEDDIIRLKDIYGRADLH